jgi:translation initiation factor IF-3
MPSARFQPTTKAVRSRPKKRALALTYTGFVPIFILPCRAPRRPVGPAGAVGFVATTQETFAIRRPMRAALPVQKDGPRINEEINVREVQLIDNEGHNRGVVPIQQALEAATAAGLDLVEIAPNSQPPVCKVLDFGKYKYQEQKKAAEARKKQKIVEIKEIKFRPMIDDHDYDVKMRSMRRFFEEGDKVKVTLRFRGREMAHQELGTKLLDRVRDDLTKLAKVEQEPKFEGRQMVMVLAPR